MKRIFKKNRMKPFKVFDENNLSSLPRIILSSIVVILFFYSLPIVINFTNNKIESSAGSKVKAIGFTNFFFLTSSSL